MIRYLVALVVLAAGGVLLLAFSCAPVERSDYPLEIAEASVETRTVSLNQGEEPEVSWRVVLSWRGLYGKDGEAVIVDKKVTEDFLVKDTLQPISEEMTFEDADTLDLEKEVTYRLVLLNQGCATLLDTIVRPPLVGMAFRIPDTVFPQDNVVRLSWEPVTEEASYEVRLMTLEALVPQPQGRRLASANLRRSGSGPLYWSVDVSGLTPGTSYIFQVSATLEDSVWNRTVTGSRLFVLGGPTKAKETN